MLCTSEKLKLRLIKGGLLLLESLVRYDVSRLYQLLLLQLELLLELHLLRSELDWCGWGPVTMASVAMIMSSTSV